MAFGNILKDSLVYFYMGLFLVCQASSYVLIKVPVLITLFHGLSCRVVLECDDQGQLAD